jgi:3-hydroxyisobutyrate dehydrogenase-like beta-hydroxyacid dehydrogenase
MKMTDRIGVIGLGNMGRPMAANLLRHRGDLVVHDLRPTAADDLREEGAVWAGDPRTLAGQVEVVVTSLPGPRQIEQVAFGESGLFSTLPSGSLWIDTSTNDPALARRLASEALDRGCAFVDAPVTGGVIGARNATLKIMAGGEEKDIERARPVFSAIASSVIHTGPAGTGCAMKLIVNFLGIAHTALAAEALSLGRAGGLTPDVMLPILEGCWGDNAMLNDIVETAGGERHWGFALDLAKKDMALVATLADAHGLSTRYGDVTRAVLDACSRSAPAGSDLWRVVEDCERDAEASIV